MQSELDRHGGFAYYVRMRGSRRIRLREEPGTHEFVDEYKLALEKLASSDHAPAPDGIVEGDVRLVGRGYRKSPAFEAWRRRPRARAA